MTRPHEMIWDGKSHHVYRLELQWAWRAMICFMPPKGEQCTHGEKEQRTLKQSRALTQWGGMAGQKAACDVTRSSLPGAHNNLACGFQHCRPLHIPPYSRATYQNTADAEAKRGGKRSFDILSPGWQDKMDCNEQLWEKDNAIHWDLKLLQMLNSAWDAR